MAQKVQVQANGKAPSGLSVGDEVVTQGGTYRIAGVNADGTYKSGLVGAVSGNEYSSTNNDIGTALNQAMANGASGDYVASVLADRTNKALTTGKSQYAYDDIYSAANEYIKNYNQKQADDAYNRGLEEANKQNSTKYTTTIDSLVDKILNGSYETWKQGGEYEALANQYSANGQKAMENTLAQVSARTGGLASSYATTASQQAYNDYMSSLESAALDMYRADRSDQMNMVSMLSGLDDTAYSRYRDTISDARYNDETSYNRSQDSYTRQLQSAETLAAYGDFSGYKALGYSDAQIATMKAAYDAAQNKSSSKGSDTQNTQTSYKTIDDMTTDLNTYLKNGGTESDFYSRYASDYYYYDENKKKYVAYTSSKAKGELNSIYSQNLTTIDNAIKSGNYTVKELRQMVADSGLDADTKRNLLARINSKSR